MIRAREISESEYEQLAIGAWILGTGGGGDPYHSLLNMKKLTRQGARVTVIDPMALADDDLVAVVSHMGAPLVSRERLPDPEMIARAVRLMERFRKCKFAAVMSIEIGGSNALQPFLAAALLDLPVVDADAMGRAFPSIYHTSFAVAGLACAPFAMIDIRGNSVVISEAKDWQWMERISRAASTEFGCRAFTCKAPRTGREVKQAGVLNTVSQAIAIGRTVQAARVAHADPVRAVIDGEGGILLFRGKVRDVSRRTTDGYLRGKVMIQGLDQDSGHEFQIEFQNEFLVGTCDGAVRVTVPDLICVLDSYSGEAVGTEALRYGQRVTVIALPSPKVFLSEAGLRHAGPGAFGYDLVFQSLFGKKAA
jgi:DUF917 family protein